MRRRIASLVLVLSFPLAVGACSQVQDTASSAASDASAAASAAASQAASKVAGAAKDELRQQICQRVADGQVSAQDQQVLSGLAAGAASAGVPDQIAGPLREIAESGDQVPAQAVSKLTQACASATSSG